jgi:hypothetical protein
MMSNRKGGSKQGFKCRKRSNHLQEQLGLSGGEVADGRNLKFKRENSRLHNSFSKQTGLRHGAGRPVLGPDQALRTCKDATGFQIVKVKSRKWSEFGDLPKSCFPCN